MNWLRVWKLKKLKFWYAYVLSRYSWPFIISDCGWLDWKSSRRWGPECSCQQCWPCTLARLRGRYKGAYVGLPGVKLHCSTDDGQGNVSCISVLHDKASSDVPLIIIRVRVKHLSLLLGFRLVQLLVFSRPLHGCIIIFRTYVICTGTKWTVPIQL